MKHLSLLILLLILSVVTGCGEQNTNSDSNTSNQRIEGGVVAVVDMPMDDEGQVGEGFGSGGAGTMEGVMGRDVVEVKAFGVEIDEPKREVVIDGVVDGDVGWEGVEWQDEFWVYQRDVKVADERAKAEAAGKVGAWAGTRYKVGFDDAYLYVGVRCDERFIEKLKAAKKVRDGEINADDCVELMLGKPGDEGEYYHFIVNSQGVVFDEVRTQGGHMGNKAWDCVGLKIGNHVDADWWGIEMAIPFAGLDIDADDVRACELGRDGWVFNIGRERYASGEWEVSATNELVEFLDASRYAMIRLVGFDIEQAWCEYQWLTNAQRWAAKDWVVDKKGPWRVVTVDGMLSMDLLGRGYEIYGRVKCVNREKMVDGKKVVEERVSEWEKLDVEGDVWGLAYGVEKPWVSEWVELEVRDVNVSNQGLGYRVARRDRLGIVGSGEALDIAMSDVIYPEEDGSQLMWRVDYGVMGIEEDKGFKLRCMVLDDQGRREDPLVDMDAGDGYYVFKLKNLDEVWEKKVVRASLLYRGREVAKVEKDLRWLSGEKPLVRICDGWTEVNGSRFYPFGWFSVPEEDWEEAKAMGCNTLMDYTISLDEPAEQKRKLDKLAAMGMKVMMYAYPERAMLQNDRWLEDLSDAERESIRQLVDRVKDHDAFMGWYIADEPELKTAKRERLEQVKALLRKYDPYHPSILVNNSMAGVNEYGRCADILMPDPYPFFLKRGGSRFGIDVVREMIDEALVIKGMHIGDSGESGGVWVTPQAFSMADFGNADNREPTALEVRNMFYQSISMGAAGQLWWAWNRGKKYTAMMEGMKQVGEEFKMIQPILEREGVEMEPMRGEDYVGAVFSRFGREELKVFVNLTEKQISVQGLKLEPLEAWVSVKGKVMRSN